VAYCLSAGQPAADGGDGTTPAPTNGTSGPAARRSAIWSPGDNWDRTLHSVRVRLVLPACSPVVAAMGPSADDAALSSGGSGGTPTAPPVVTFPFQTMRVAADVKPVVVT